MAEWLRRQTRNLVGSALVGSNPADVVFIQRVFNNIIHLLTLLDARFWHFVRVVKELAC